MTAEGCPFSLSSAPSLCCGAGRVVRKIFLGRLTRHRTKGNAHALLPRHSAGAPRGAGSLMRRMCALEAWLRYWGRAKGGCAALAALGDSLLLKGRCAEQRMRLVVVGP